LSTFLLKKPFYLKKTESVAKSLLGKRLVSIRRGKRVSGTIVETEAYLGESDPACHSFDGRRTGRNEAMYLEGGHAYVYLIYGMYNCFNVVTRRMEVPEAVLIRAVEPDKGEELMWKRRPKAKKRTDLTSGPGKLCQAMGITRRDDGLSLQGERIFIEEGIRVPRSQVESAPRVGVDYAGPAALWPLRFFIKDNPFVSVKPKRLLIAEC
jgi:DNA-3-methyladenine glycosylase